MILRTTRFISRVIDQPRLLLSEILSQTEPTSYVGKTGGNALPTDSSVFCVISDVEEALGICPAPELISLHV